VLVDLLTIVLTKTEGYDRFTRKLLDLVVRCFQFVKGHIGAFETKFLNIFQSYMGNKQASLLTSINDLMLRNGWRYKDPNEIRFVLTVSIHIIIDLYNYIYKI